MSDEAAKIEAAVRSQIGMKTNRELREFAADPLNQGRASARIALAIVAEREAKEREERQRQEAKAVAAEQRERMERSLERWERRRTNRDTLSLAERQAKAAEDAAQAAKDSAASAAIQAKAAQDALRLSKWAIGISIVTAIVAAGAFGWDVLEERLAAKPDLAPTPPVKTAPAAPAKAG